jgi:hypothetical protein
LIIPGDKPRKIRQLQGATELRLSGIFAAVLCGLAAPATAEPIKQSDLRVHIEVLASDAFEGRKPGTVGENLTISYIASRLARDGILPGRDDGAFYDPVALTERTAGKSKIALNAQNSSPGKLPRAKSNLLAIRGAEATYSVDLPLVYAGFGIDRNGRVLPGVEGNAVIINAETPDWEGAIGSARNRREMLIAAGARAVLVYNEKPGPSRRSFRRLNQSTLRLAGPDNHAVVEGVIAPDLLAKLLERAGLTDWKTDELLEAENFTVLDLGVRLTASGTTDVRPIQSHNVLGRIKGNGKSNEAIMLMGHWDHFGICEPNSKAHKICNGAVDNASGIAALLEVAEHLAAGPRLDRDIYILATTAEESGLLGAYAFANTHPDLIKRLVAVLNLDTIAIAAGGTRVAVIGKGRTALDADVEQVARETGRIIDASDDAQAYVLRQDGWVFLERGIPSLMINSSFADTVRLQAFLDTRYHSLDDQVDDRLELGGATDDANFHIALARHFASLTTFPIAEKKLTPAPIAP